MLDGAKIGDEALVAAGAVVTPGTEIPAGTLAVGAPAKVKGPLEGTPAAQWIDHNPRTYGWLTQMHIDGMREITPNEVKEP